VSNTVEGSANKAEKEKTMSVEEALKLNERLKSEENSNNKESADTTEGTQSAKDQTTESISQDTKESVATVKRKVLERTQSKQSRSVNLMQQCINCFKEFFHTLVSDRFIKSEADLETYFQQIMTSNKYSDSYYDEYTAHRDRNGGPGYKKVELGDCTDECLQMFSVVCNLLVEFASFPMYGQHKMDRDKQAGELAIN